MLRSRVLSAAVLALVLVISFQSASRAEGFYRASATCGPDNKITVTWSYQESPPNPSAHPEWVGYDVLRRSQVTCGGYERVNAETFARIPGESQDFSFTDTPPASNTLFEYMVVPVDADRKEVSLGADCTFCDGRAWASCPELSAPLAHGTLEDLGWAFSVRPCAGGCYTCFFFTGPIMEELRRYVGTATTIRFFGTAFCGTTDGCGMVVSRYELAPCDATPVERQTWGTVKAAYR